MLDWLPHSITALVPLNDCQREQAQDGSRHGWEPTGLGSHRGTRLCGLEVDSWGTF